MTSVTQSKDGIQLHESPMHPLNSEILIRVTPQSARPLMDLNAPHHLDASILDSTIHPNAFGRRMSLAGQLVRVQWSSCHPLASLHDSGSLYVVRGIDQGMICLNRWYDGNEEITEGNETFWVNVFAIDYMQTIDLVMDAAVVSEEENPPPD